MLNEFIFNHINSSEYEVFLTGAGVFEAPARRYEKVSIDGRNGDLILDENSVFPVYENIEIRYPAVIFNNFQENYENLKSVLSANLGYSELSDTIEPERFRLGTFKEITKLKMTNHLDAGTFEIIFDCKPQWFLKAGNDILSVLSDGVIYNPTSHYSKPLIKVFGAGTIGLNNQVITVSNNTDDYLYIDSEIEDAYKGVLNRNSDVVFSNNEFPLLKPAENEITLNGITLEITPRWFEI